MQDQRLTTYLRSYRRRSGLSQEEVAYLLGTNGQANVSRHERSERAPSLRTVLAYEIIFGVPARDLYIGLFFELRRSIVKRAEGQLLDMQDQSLPIQVEGTLLRICRMYALEESATKLYGE